MPTVQHRNGAFRARVRITGHPTESATFDTEAQAWAWAYKREMILKASDPDQDPDPPFAAWVELYIEREAGRWVTGQDKISRLRRVAQDELGAVRVSRLTPTAFEQLRARLEAKGLAQQTVRHYLQDCSAVWQAARRKWRVTELPNPLREIDMPKVSSGRRGRVSPQLETQVFGALDRHVNPFYGPFARFLLETSLRVSEALSIEVGNIMWDQHVLSVCGKGGAWRTVPLSPGAEDLLRTAVKLRQVTPLQFSAPNGGHYDLSEFSEKLVWPITYTGFYRAWKKAAGQSGAWIHDLRRERATRLLEGGMNTVSVKNVTGHSSTDTLDTHYAAIAAQRVAQELRRLAAADDQRETFSGPGSLPI